MTELTTGSVIVGYRIEGLAREGGMGVVYRATQLALGRPVALKVISPKFADDARFRQRFKRESQLAASVDHPNVIPVYEAGETNGCLFISMRWVEGSDLNTLIRRGGGLDAERATRIVGQVAAGLDAAHACGLVHRDVKPANILVVAGPAEHVYLTDFGLVKRMRTSGELTRDGELLGTIDYIAPEQIQGKGSDARSDVYSLGCVLFHCLTGRVPFETDSEIAKIYAHLHESPPPPSELSPELPVALDAVVARAMAKEPAHRYQTAGDLGRAALAVSGEDSTPESQRPEGTRAAATLTLADAKAGRAADRPRARSARQWGVGGVLVAASVLVLLALAGVFGGERGPEAGGASAAVPHDGTLLRAEGSPLVYVVKAGAKFGVPARERAVFGYSPQEVRAVSGAALGRVPNIPRDGALVKPYGSTLVWVVRRGERSLTAPLPGADVATIPSTGLRQVPLPPGRRPTSIVLAAPRSVEERRAFLLAAQVRSRSGVPAGACVFYRITPGGLKERGNTPARDGRCEAHLRVGGLPRVRYSVHFIGDRGWGGSTAATDPIEVLPR